MTTSSSRGNVWENREEVGRQRVSAEPLRQKPIPLNGEVFGMHDYSMGKRTVSPAWGVCSGWGTHQAFHGGVAQCLPMSKWLVRAMNSSERACA